MAENTLLEKVLSLQDKYKKLEEQLADPAVIADMKKFVQPNQQSYLFVCLPRARRLRTLRPPLPALKNAPRGAEGNLSG